MRRRPSCAVPPIRRVVYGRIMFDYAAHGLNAPTARPEIPDRPQTVAEVLDPVLARDPDRPALVGRSGRYTYRELDREANRAAHALRALGIAAARRRRPGLPHRLASARPVLPPPRPRPAGRR